jgi:hypothetical protein
MDQTCPVVHKSRRPQARLKTVTLFYINCECIVNLLIHYTFYTKVACPHHRLPKLPESK